MLKFLIFILILSAPIRFAFASKGGVSAGGGGQGVLCRNVGSLMDFYEARLKYHFSPSLKSDMKSGAFVNTLNALDLVRDVVFETDSRALPDFAPVFKLAITEAKMIDENQERKSLVQLEPTNDTGASDVVTALGCTIFQAARFQHLDGQVPTVEFFSSGLVYFDSNEVTGLIIHEALHLYFDVESDTRAIRQFVTFIGAPSKFQQINKERFALLLKTRRHLEDGFQYVPLAAGDSTR